MNDLDYEYSGLMAQTWDVLRGDTSTWPDRPFFMEIIRQHGQPALDVGCGTGRLLLDYVQLGIDIDGVDNSPEMLAICQQKADELECTVNLFEQQMETLKLPRQYGTILVPSSSLQLIVDPSMVDQVLQRLHAHLLPGGLMAASIMALREEGEPLEFEWEQIATREIDGAKFRRVGKSRYDPETELEHTDDLYQMIVNEEIIAEERHRRSPATRSYDQNQAKALFERAGFRNVQLYGGFTSEPVKPTDTMFVVVGQR